MYKIYADDTLIYDSEADDLKIGKGQVSLETNKSGSFVFSVYPDHPFYDSFIKLRTVVTVYKSGRIVFRGRILNDVTDYWNNKVITCEGELGFLQDSIMRPYSFQGTPAELFRQWIEFHNSQVDAFKRFNIGDVTVFDPNDYIARSNSGYETVFSNLNSRLLEDSLGGYLYVTHGDDGADPTPTIHYLADLPHVASQYIEFGSNLKNYTKTVQGDSIATAIIPLGAQIEGTDERLNIESVNGGVDYVYDEEAVALYGWVFKVVEWDDVTEPGNLLTKARAYLKNAINQLVTIELTAVDLHMLDRSIESFGVNDYVRVVSEPHGIAQTYLCQKQTTDLLNPGNDTITLGRTYATFTGNAVKLTNTANRMASSVAGAYSAATSASGAAANAANAANNAANAANNAVTAVGKLPEEIKALGDKTAAYKIAEQQMTSLMAQAFGMFKTEEVLPDGSTVSYLHDKPQLANSTKIWKMTADGFSVSTNGGKTWNAGITSSGNALVNILSAIGIQASWIEATNLAAISANLGGWLIDNTKIYKVIQHPTDSRTRYRVYFKPPVQSSNAVTTEILTCEVSTDSGATWTDLLVLDADGTAILHSTDKGTYKIHGSYMELIDANGVQIARMGTQNRVSTEVVAEEVLEEEVMPAADDEVLEEDIIGGGEVTEEVIEEVLDEVYYDNKFIPELVLREDSNDEHQAVVNPSFIQFGDSEKANRAYLRRDEDGRYVLRVDAIEIKDRDSNRMASIKFVDGEYVLKVDEVDAQRIDTAGLDAGEIATGEITTSFIYGEPDIYANYIEAADHIDSMGGYKEAGEWFEEKWGLA